MTKIINPFRVKPSDVIEVFKREGGGVFEFADTRSGEVSLFEKQVKSRRVIVDRGNYVKVYKGSYEVIRLLSPNAMKLFMYICFHIGIHSDSIIFSYETTAVFCGWKKSLYYVSVNELIEREVICRRNGSSTEFFINPNYIFNGSRLKLK